MTNSKSSGSKKADKPDANARRLKRHKKQMLEALQEHGGNVTKASAKVGLHRSMHYDYMQDPEYAKQVNLIYDEVCDKAEQTIIDLMDLSEQDKVRLDAAKEILKARGKSRGYGVEKREQQHEGEINTTQKVIIKIPSNGREPTRDN